MTEGVFQKSNKYIMTKLNFFQLVGFSILLFEVGNLFYQNKRYLRN